MLSGGAYAAAVLLFVVVSAAFLYTRNRLGLEKLSRFDGTDELDAALSGTPLHDAGSQVPVPATCPLSRGQTRVLKLVATVSRLMVASVVGAGVLLFFTVLGAIAVPMARRRGPDHDRPRRARRAAHGPQELRRHRAPAAGRRLPRGVSGFYDAVVSVVDPTMRQEMRDTVTETVREACAARLVVLHSTDPESTT